MKFCKQALSICTLGFVLGATSGAVKSQTLGFNPEPFVVLCAKNKVNIIWEQHNYKVIVTGIFCTNDEDMVKFLKPSPLPKVTKIL